MAILEVRGVRFSHGRGKKKKEVLCGASASFEEGRVYALLGKSGAGKSTFLSLLSALLLPDEGEVLFDGKKTSELNALAYRRNDVAMIYQDFALFPLLNVTENIVYPMSLQKKKPAEQRQRAKELAGEVGLAPELMPRYPAAISGGEQQRVAIARALAAGARVILADEPTGNLDSANSEQIVELLKKSAHEEGRCVIIVTHDPEVAKNADAVLRLEDGTIREVG